MRPVTNELREQVKIRIKNKIDISNLIEDVNIKNEDLSRAIISKLRIIDGDISGCNFSHATLGSDDNIFTLIRVRMNNCNFEGANFIGKAWIRSCKATNCNFREADVANVSYEHTDFSNSTFCGVKMRLDSRTNIGCTFPKEIVIELVKNWNNEIIIQ